MLYAIMGFNDMSLQNGAQGRGFKRKEEKDVEMQLPFGGRDISH